MTLETFTHGYMTAALWSSNDESRDDGGDPMDWNYTVEDIAPETRANMEADCRAFYDAHADLLNYDHFEGRSGSEGVDHSAGIDFWFTRCGHGAGFWDGDWREPAATTLTDAAHAFGNIDLLIGDDGLVHAC